MSTTKKTYQDVIDVDFNFWEDVDLVPVLHAWLDENECGNGYKVALLEQIDEALELLESYKYYTKRHHNLL